ncbi:MAG: hypothetical protein AB1467_03330 [Candidatus Diapherotrites archaeon]
MVRGICRKCNRKEDLRGGLCEDCASEEEAKRNPLNETREKLTKEELEKQMAEKRHDKRFWTSG